MKKWVTGILILSALMAQAAFQYEVVLLSDNTGPDVWGDEYAIRITEGSGTLYLVDHINNLYSANQNESLLDNITAFGYVNLTTGESGEGSFDNSITTYEHAMSEWNDVVTQKGYAIGEFSAGDEIAIWVTTTDGYTGSTAGQGDGAYNDDQLTWRKWNVDPDVLGNEAGQFAIGGASVVFGLTGVEGSGGGTVTGQPLPGVIPAVLIGTGVIGAAGFSWKRRKHKA
ncbi:MAG: hypothetical protein AB7E95_02140 [Kiritimatiellales bacterium]